MKRKVTRTGSVEDFITTFSDKVKTQLKNLGDAKMRELSDPK